MLVAFSEKKNVGHCPRPKISSGDRGLFVAAVEQNPVNVRIQQTNHLTDPVQVLRLAIVPMSGNDANVSQI
jgi:hypothetical protein